MALVYCAFCGKGRQVESRLSTDEHRREAVEHMKTCPQHPLRTAEADFRRAWAEYFDARAAASEANADVVRHEPQKQLEWVHKAAGERECAAVLRMTDWSLEKLRALIRAPSPAGAKD